MDTDFEESYLSNLASSSSTPAGLRPYYIKLVDLYNRKLWYQLTLSLDEFLSHPDSQNPPSIQIELYERFVTQFEKKINQLSRAAIAVKVARQHEDPSQAIAFLQRIIPSIAPAPPAATPAAGSGAAAAPSATMAATTGVQAATSSGQSQSLEAYVFVSMEAAHFQLLLGNLAQTKKTMDECQKILDGFDSVEMGVNAAYYRVCGDYHKAKAEYAPYYKNSLLYLACVNLDKDLSKDDQIQRAHDLAISALLGDTIYNFGELLLHPILSVLQSTPHSYLSDLLHAFNSGDLGRFESLLPHLSSNEPILAENQPFLRQKICLMALIESVFKRSSEDRVISFEAIGRETRLPADEVEHLVMKALSLKLIRGTMDQHKQEARITWVQPRVLSRPQIEALHVRLGQWCEKVKEVGEFVKGQTAPELITTA
ncbi:hypothetical protein K437DRAFT_230506 [Tilletiaria anomala UBC 951]|uniref:PCI domain-containing protein n=1 Tax=Tilletiaria anomala (strain ATCC 24038 / CBS 436.72 / UBC 951) TaxID=1037660 RepID=A0A066WSI6_TILAU|nr:uncharacterized protein K437DRAFT_230506 [Tilletiaria anomala UBC 951]KDN53645.1 hypothetical protein K437DRAFT_230506 [Tilletiaria anomala UBC 951]